jgi:ATP-dependent exoDNAse (exonuclease V) beta subunit
VNEVPDHAARQQALDTSQSVLVQAPAGSGKTELLASRLLKLLAQVDEPEQVLGITFTKAATAEMRNRIVRKLEAARSFEESGTLPPGEDSADIEIARAALANAKRRNWQLLERPSRINVTTIDALCLQIARQAPLRAGLSGVFNPVEDARSLYQKAARKTLDRLGGEDVTLHAALRSLLLLRDSNLDNVETLLAQMLATRDQWARSLPLTGDVDWKEVRANLERTLEQAIIEVLAGARLSLTSRPEIASELIDLVRYAGRHCSLPNKIQSLSEMVELPLASPESLDEWLVLCEFLLTKQCKLRKQFDADYGLPRGKSDQKDRFRDLAARFAKSPDLVGMLQEISVLPASRYSEAQWEALRDIFTALRSAVRDLNVAFAEQGAIDFVQIGMAALDVLRSDATRQFPRSIQHLLVDEFQDTSRRQHELIAELIRDWRPGDGRTLFLVGDPMQSIYMFRQADVELFEMVRQRGIETRQGMLSMTTAYLETNFRSKHGVVKPLNAIFESVFPHQREKGAVGVDFLPSRAHDPEELEHAFTLHPTFALKSSRTKNSPSQNASTQRAHEEEVAEIVSIIRHHLPRVEQARNEGREFTIGVLGRAKDHLLGIAHALREERIPFRAVEMETLGERQEILDLRSLLRALLHPMDRIAWLALLRAPWCGLSLREIHLLCSTDDRRAMRGSVQRQLESNVGLLEEDSRLRVEHLSSVLNAALRLRHRQTSLASWIERTWRSLGGPSCVDAAAYQNALTFFSMLDELGPEEVIAGGEAMDTQLDRLFASPDPTASERQGVQLMTIHKAKGLGFNVVVVPAMHRPTRTNDPALFRYLERATDNGTGFLLAPIGAKGDKTPQLNSWVKRQQDKREREERKRLLYVACTRAREELHLFATASVTGKGLSPESGSLLQTAWPALSPRFEEAHQASTERASGNILQFPSFLHTTQAVGGTLTSLAASSASAALRRLPSGVHRESRLLNGTSTGIPGSTSTARTPQARERPQASHNLRTLGTIVHALLERVARNFESSPEERGHPDLAAVQRYARTLARHAGMTAVEAERCSSEAVEALQSALSDPYGQWILKPRPVAQTETSWSGILDGTLRTLRIDRSFPAGPEPLSEGQDHLWIIDYKTADRGEKNLVAFFAEERSLYEAQLGDYGRIMLQTRHEGLQLRLGLYYPMLKRLIWWVA